MPTLAVRAAMDCSHELLPGGKLTRFESEEALAIVDLEQASYLLWVHAKSIAELGYEMKVEERLQKLYSLY